jgi:hypothetical protein
MSPIIFTEELLSAKSSNRSILHEWARTPAFRSQIERVATLVPDDKRKRVLGPLSATSSSSSDQVMTVVNSLLLAQTLIDLGWTVEFEPEEANGTPDFLISKGKATYIVEIRRVAKREIKPLEKAIERIRNALVNIKTHTPIHILAANVGGEVSLKPFVKLSRERPVHVINTENRKR